jgi:hypothetical protein
MIKEIKMQIIKKSIIVLFLLTALNPFLNAADWHNPTEYDKTLQADVSLLAAYPAGKFSDIYKFGYGIVADISYVPGFKQDYRLAFRTGFIRLEPESETDDRFKTGTGNSYIIPVLASFEYRFKFLKYYVLAPAISGGFSINKADYMDRSGTVSGGVPTGYPAQEVDKISFEPFTTAGLGFHYLLNWTDSIFVRGEWCTIVEPDDPMFFGAVSFGYEKRF